MNRREFLTGAAAGLSAAYLKPAALGATALDIPALTQKYKATDTVVLGKTGIRTSRLAMGTGTIGGGGGSNQTRTNALPRLLLNGYDNGLLFFDTADSYGSHPDVAEALKHVSRDKVTVMTKCDSRDPKQARANLDRYRRELKTDYIDICLMHCLTEDDWTERYRGVMDVFSEAKEKGIIRSHGVSCHSIGALRAAAKSPWVEIDLRRLRRIHRVIVVNRFDCCSDRDVPLVVQLRDAQGNYHEVARRTENFNRVTLDFPPQEATAVKLVVPRVTAFHLANVQIR